MKRYFLDRSTEISEEEAERINEKNIAILESGDFERMVDIRFIAVIDDRNASVLTIG